MITPINRRSLLFKAPALAGASIAGLSLSHSRPLFAEQLPPYNPPLSPALLSFVSNRVTLSTAKAYSQILQGSDITATTSALQLLIEHFSEIGFDQAFIQYAAALGPPAIDFSTSNVVTTATTGVQTIVPGFSRATMQSAFEKLMPANQLPAQWNQISTKGVTPSLTGALQSITALEASAGGFCSWLNWITAALGAAAFELSLGCLPVDPFFLVICPAVTVLGVIAALLAIIDWIVC